MQDVQSHLPDLISLMRQADAAIMSIYDAHSAIVETKDDNSPVTQADIASHDILVAGLTQLFPDIPIVSEEGDGPTNTALIRQPLFWLVDPIDGTKEFLKRTGEFTVCVGLIKDGEPVFGMVSVSDKKTLYYGRPGMGSYKIVGEQEVEAIHVAPHKTGIILGSSTHKEGATGEYIAQHYPDTTVQTYGSQLKFVYVAEGRADAYPRLGSTMKLWDTAAGHAILLGAGGDIRRPDGSALNYNEPSMLIGNFVASA